MKLESWEIREALVAGQYRTAANALLSMHGISLPGAEMRIIERPSTDVYYDIRIWAGPEYFEWNSNGYIHPGKKLGYSLAGLKQLTVHVWNPRLPNR